jgi:hypothetical protein
LHRSGKASALTASHSVVDQNRSEELRPGLSGTVDQAEGEAIHTHDDTHLRSAEAGFP